MDTRILVIDDDQSMCELLCDYLQSDRDGERRLIDWRLSGDEGLDLVSEHDFDVIISDINLENMSGLELCRKLHENRPDTPVIMITAFGSMANAVAAIRAGAFDFINKPIEMAALTDAVNRAARQKVLRYDWPGKVRQLENSMERAVALTRSEQIEAEDRPERVRSFEGRQRAALAEGESELVLSLDEVEKRHIQRALRAAKGNKTQTAKALGVDRRTLYRKLERFEAERVSPPRA